jgi:hypothetical protein
MHEVSILHDAPECAMLNLNVQVRGRRHRLLLVCFLLSSSVVDLWALRLRRQI